MVTLLLVKPVTVADMPEGAYLASVEVELLMVLVDVLVPLHRPHLVLRFGVSAIFYFSIAPIPSSHRPAPTS